jgi:pantoate--beta-alanine ligase
MLVEKTAKISANLEQKKLLNKTISFVPTMGALHEGHLALVKKAKELADIVVVSIFVNRAQFDDPNDYLKYPQTLESDIKKLENYGVDYIFSPSEKEMNLMSFVENKIPQNLKNCLCGSTRPGHFEGVTMIVSKFLNIIKPDIVIFGQKDFQQCLIVKNLIENYCPNIQIFLLETVREKSGLAMSSRNQRLSEEEKIKAANIYHLLQEIKNEALDEKNIEKILQEKKSELLKIGFEKIDYLEIRDEKTLQLTSNYDDKKSLRIFVAVYLNGVRLIDNLKIN